MNSYSTIRTGDFVTDGIMLALPLCFPGQSVPPPADETLINAMAEDVSAMVVYLGTAGRAAHMMVAAIHADAGVVHDLGIIPGADRIDAVGIGDKWVYFVTSGSDGSALWKHPRLHTPSFLIQEWGMTRQSPVKVCDLIPGKRVAGAVFNTEGCLYGLSEGDGQFFKLDLTAKEIRPEIIGPVDEPVTAQASESHRPFFSSRVVVDCAGRAWGTSGSANLWYFEPSTGKIVRTKRYIPAGAGREAHTTVSAWTVDPVTGTLYGGTSPDGFFFEFDPTTQQLTPLGKPTRLDEIHCITFANDGRVYGIAGTADDIGHLFMYDPFSGALADLGVPVSTLSTRQYGYHFRCALTRAGGEICLGQHERASHLWLYFPPVPRRNAPVGECRIP